MARRKPKQKNDRDAKVAAITKQSAKLRKTLKSLDELAGVENAKWLATDQAEVADFFGISVNTLSIWRKMGMPGARGGWPLDQIAKWLRKDGPWRRFGAAGVDELDADGPDSPALEESRRWRAKLLEQEFRKREGELVDVGYVSVPADRIMARLRRCGEQLGVRFGPEAQIMVNDAIDDCKRTITGIRRNGNGAVHGPELVGPDTDGVGNSGGADDEPVGGG